MSGGVATTRRPVSVRRLGLQLRAVTVLLALVFGLLAAAAVAVYEHTRPVFYQSTATLLIDQPLAVAASDSDGPLAKLQRLRYQYASVVRTETIAAPVARQLDLPIGQVEAALTCAVDPLSFTMVVYATTARQAQASLIAQAAASQLASYVSDQQTQHQIQAIDQVTLTEVSSPRLGVAVGGATTKKTLLTAAIVGVLVAAAFIAASDLLRRTA